MVFRLPTHLDSYIPPPSEMMPQPSPWRGTLVVSGLRASDKGATQDLFVTAVETDGDKGDLWPSQLYVHPAHDRPILGQVKDWVRRHTPPLCTFMPDRLRDPNATTVNQANFRSFSRILFENQMVALAPWHHGRVPGAGIIIYPASNSTALLVGAIFLSSPFPEFIASAPLLHSSMSMPPRHYPDNMASPPTGYGPVPQNTPRHAGPSHRHPQLGPTDQAHPDNNKQDHYRYIMPRPGPAAYPYPSAPSAADASWTAVKNEEDLNLATAYVPSHRTDLGQGSQYPQ